MGDAINAAETSMTTLKYGDKWRLHRRLMYAQHSAVGTQAVRNDHDFQATEPALLIRDFFLDPNDYELSVERYSVSVASIIGWGRRIDRKNDHVAQLALASMEVVDYVIPRVFIMEIIPLLLHVPAWLYKPPSKLRPGSATLSRYFYLLTQEGAEAKQDNFASYVLEAQHKHRLSDAEADGLTGLIIGGGVDTTSSTMLSCILAKANAETDAAIGHDRSPTWTDIDSQQISCLIALVKETLCWRTVTVLAGIPHANTKPADYNGYHFPAGTNLTATFRAIHRHPRDSTGPDNFLPERFLDAEGNVENVISSSSLTRGNQVKRAILASPKSGMMRPEPFKVRVVPRSERIKEVLLREAAEAREALRCYDGETEVALQKALESLVTV